MNIRVVNSLSKDNSNNNNNNNDRSITFNARFPKGSPYRLISLPSFTISPKESSKTITFFVSGPRQQQQQPLNMIISANIDGGRTSPSTVPASGDDTNEALLINGMNGFTIKQQPSEESPVDAVITKSGTELLMLIPFLNTPCPRLHSVSMVYFEAQ